MTEVIDFDLKNMNKIKRSMIRSRKIDFITHITKSPNLEAILVFRGPGNLLQ